LKRKHQRIDPLAAMAAANPASVAELGAGIGAAELEQALARAVATGRAPSEPIPAGDRVAHERGASSGRAGFGRRRRRTTLALGLVTIAVLAALLVAGGWPGSPGSGRPEFAAAAIRVATANPRLLVTEPGWKIIRADEFEPENGELTFSDGSRQFELHWYPARLYADFLRDRANVSAPEHGTLLGQRATTVDYGRKEYATMLSPQGKVFIEVRGRLGSKSAYERILHSLRPVSVDAWLSSMPPSTVRPQAHSETVERMLQGIPLPPGFDATALQSEGSIANRSTLAVKVANAVACGWVESWIAAGAAGDEAAAERAVEAMAGSATWPIVRKTRSPWFSNYKGITKQLRAGRLDRSPSGYETTASGKTFGFGPAWKMFLGCGGTYRREVDGLPGERP
jgi:hypothetical protein